MKLTLCLLLATCVIAVNCSHMFHGTNVNRQLASVYNATYDPIPFRPRKEYYYFTMPAKHSAKKIKGILAEDKTNVGAIATIKEGGVGKNFATLRLECDRGKKMFFRIYVYV